MKLNRIEIVNYRSIASATISMEPSCRILIGINESGKSNVLQALALLDPAQKGGLDDLRVPRNDEEIVDTAYVRFIFRVEADDRDILLTRLRQKVFAESFQTTIFTDQHQKSTTFEQYVDSVKEGIYRIDLPKGTRSSRYFGLSEKHVIEKDWVKPSETAPAGLKFWGPDGTARNLDDFNLLYLPNISLEVDGMVEPALAADVGSIVGTEITTLLDEQLPECIYWKYSEANLLPTLVNLTSFAASPESCLPLKYMFDLAGLPDIPKAIEQARKSVAPNQAIKRLLIRVAENATRHVNEIWSGHRPIKIELSPNADNIDISIMEEGIPFDFARRSDGFKRLVTFVLMISTKLRTDDLTNTLLLIDEPEIGLHPAGAKSLLAELLKISGQNFVVFSTHSIFMIDKENIPRHYIVKKNGLTTELTEAEKSRICEEEVLFNAIGYSVFETLRESNIIFEGWRDKQLFRIGVNAIKKKSKLTHATLGAFGLTHAEGTKDIRNVAGFLEIAGRQLLILSDCDQVALEAKKRYEAQRGYGQWLTYNDLLPGAPLETGEDFIAPSAFVAATKILAKSDPAIPLLTEADLLVHKFKLPSIRKKLTDSGILSLEAQKAIIDSIKEYVFTHLKGDQLEDIYFDYLDAVAQLKPNV